MRRVGCLLRALCVSFIENKVRQYDAVRFGVFFCLAKNPCCLSIGKGAHYFQGTQAKAP